MSEETSSKKEEEFLGVPLSKLGPYAIGLGGLALLASIAVPFLKPQIEGMQRDIQQRQAYAQQQQLLAAQAQQQQQQQQLQYQQGPTSQEQQGMPEQPEQPPQTAVDPQSQYAVEQDPFNRQNPRRVRIPEVDSEGAGTSRFNNISI